MIEVKDGVVKAQGNHEELFGDLLSVVAVMKLHLPIGLIEEAIEAGMSQQAKVHNTEVMQLLEYILERRDAQKNEGTTDTNEGQT